MEGYEQNDGMDTNDRDEIYSNAVKAGKRTYFFDVKATRNNDYYLTITELSKIEAAPTHLLNEKVDVPMMLRVVEREAQTLSQKKQTFTFEIDNGLKVSGNEDQLRSAISNLVYNAVNHTPEGTHITVRWQRVPHGAEFSVEDNGPGIAPEHIPRLTERFYRVDKARSRQTGGSGLGLAIVKHAVNHHESRLNIESTVGKGTRFSFVIPERLIAKNSD